MASKEFDVDQLAAYLHMTPDKIAKLASQGRLPGRRIAGDWRFSESDIHHWLEDKIGASDPKELSKMENIFERSADVDDFYTAIADYLPIEAISIPLAARTRGSVIRRMCEVAAGTGLLWDADTMANAVSAREDLHPTALENGVAMLHPRRPQSSILAEPLLALGISSSPLPFGNTSGHLTDVFFLICSTDDRVHLRLLARLSRLISDSVWLTQLRSSTSPAEALELIRTGELELLAQQS
ncbi:MAG: PTS sugar transporter subunit IIA [Pirellulaceae bacterium]|nr:PTS sugar transporter subunit IIA [Pirellulaceae bacterium]